MFIADLPRRQCFWEAVAIELRIGTGSRHRPHVDDEMNARFLEQLGEFDDRSSGMAYGEEGVRVGSNGTLAPAGDPYQRRFVSETALVLPNIPGA
jgi:hypothetical protein